MTTDVSARDALRQAWQDRRGAAELAHGRALDAWHRHLDRTAPNGFFTKVEDQQRALQLREEIAAAERSVAALRFVVDPEIAACVPLVEALRTEFEQAWGALERLVRRGSDDQWRRDPDNLWLRGNIYSPTPIAMMFDGRGNSVPRPGQDAHAVLAGLDRLVEMHAEVHRRLTVRRQQLSDSDASHGAAGAAGSSPAGLRRAAAVAVG